MKLNELGNKVFTEELENGVDQNDATVRLILHATNVETARYCFDNELFIPEKSHKDNYKILGEQLAEVVKIASSIACNYNIDLDRLLENWL